MPVRSEIDIDGCHVDGTIPTGLRGSFIRNGPNPAFEPLGSYHMFDGDGMLHGITFGDDGVSYRNRWIRSRVWVPSSLTAPPSTTAWPR